MGQVSDSLIQEGFFFHLFTTKNELLEASDTQFMKSQVVGTKEGRAQGHQKAPKQGRTTFVLSCDLQSICAMPNLANRQHPRSASYPHSLCNGQLCLCQLEGTTGCSLEEL